jgi:hypothetical protein
VSFKSSHQDRGFVRGSDGSCLLAAADRRGTAEDPVDMLDSSIILPAKRARCASVASAMSAYPVRAGMRKRDLEETVAIFPRQQEMFLL